MGEGEKEMGRIVKPFAPEQLRELHDRNRPGAPNPISAEDLAEFLRQPDFWREGSSAVVLDEHDETQDVRFWMQNVYRELGLRVDVPPVPKLTPKQQKSFSRFTFRLFFVPRIGEDSYPSYFVKPAWGRDLETRRIERRVLLGEWVGVETIAKPNYQSGDYHEDRLAEAIGLKSRFSVSWDELYDGGLLAKIAKVTGFPKRATRLPTAEEWNFLANLMGWLNSEQGKKHFPLLGSTDAWEWCANVYDSPNRRLLVGSSDHGGLTNVNSYWHSDHGVRVGFRVLVEL